MARVDVPVTFSVPVKEAFCKKACAVKVSPVPEALPKIGVTKVGDVCKTFNPEPVLPVTNNAPPEVDSTVPAVRDDKVVEPVTLRVPESVVEAKVEVPVTNKFWDRETAVAEALPRVVCPVTIKVPVKVPLVKVGEATTVIVGLVEVVIVMLEPAIVFHKVK